MIIAAKSWLLMFVLDMMKTVIFPIRDFNKVFFEVINYKYNHLSNSLCQFVWPSSSIVITSLVLTYSLGIGPLYLWSIPHSF